MPEPTPVWVLGAGPYSQHGNILQATTGLPAVMRAPYTYPDRPDLEDAELLSLLCGGVLGLTEVLAGQGVELPASLRRWAVGRDAPAAEFGAGQPTVLLIDGQRTLAMRWDIERVTAVAAFGPAGYTFVLAEASSSVIELCSVDIGHSAQDGF